MKKDLSTEEKIKKAATKIFIAKGLSGARMQDIAKEAGVNKAMLHYYFGSKEKLFDIIFDEKLMRLLSSFSVIANTNLSFEDKVRGFVSAQISVISEFPNLPLFILNELNQNPDRLREKFKNFPIGQMSIFIKHMFETEIAAGRIREISFEQFLMNMVSLNLYPFVGKPIFQMVLDVNDKEYDQMMYARKELVADLLINDLKRK